MNRIYLKRILLIFRLFLIGMVTVLFFWLFLKDFVPDGVIVYRNDFGFKDGQISDLYPDVRVRKIEQDALGDYFQNMFVDPVYFKVNPPREFSRVKVRVKYRSRRQPLFQVGVKAGPRELDFKFWPLEFGRLDNLDWHKVRDGDLTLFQRVRRYETVSDFLNNLPKDGRIAIFNMDLEIPEDGGYKTTILNLNTDLEHVSFIIANYKEPEVVDEWKFSEVEFDITRENFFGGRLIFILSAPEIDDNKGDIDISEITVTLMRPKFEWGNAVGEFKEYLRSVFDK